MKKRTFTAILVLLVALCFSGCGPRLPEVISASGVVTIDGKPLNKAVVSFIPMSEGLSGSHIASGITDENGKFTLSFYSEAGVYCGLNKVTVRDEPFPDEGRALTEEGARVRAEHTATLLNRPIPEEYLTVARTPLSFEVESDKNDYIIDIKR